MTDASQLAKLTGELHTWHLAYPEATLCALDEALDVRLGVVRAELVATMPPAATCSS